MKRLPPHEWHRVGATAPRGVTRARVARLMPGRQVSDVARALDISTQAVYQHLDALAKEAKAS